MSPIVRFAFFALFIASLARAGERVVVYFPKPLPDAVMEQSMKSEFAALTVQLGFRAEWRLLNQTNGQGEEGQLIVVRPNGDCSAGAPESDVASGDVIASVQEVDGRILPFINVNCAHLVSLVRPLLKGQTPHEQQIVLGRAMARVIAHEVHHVIGQNSGHTAEGITKARVHGADLASRTAQLAPASPSATELESSLDASGTGGR